ncbi:MAG: hypothetical protein ACR2P5_01270 [Gammaproteobacteria bacterium]
MKRRDILIFGGGHLGRQIVHHIRNYCEANIHGFIDDTKKVGEPILNELCCVGGLDEVHTQPEFAPDRVSIVFAIGYSDMLARKHALERVTNAGYSLFRVIHPRSIIEPGAQVGEGVIVLGGAILDQNVSIGDACFVDIGVRIGEDSIVGNNNYFSSGAAIGGGVTIGHSNFFGMDITITNGIRVGSNVFVNAKTLVPRDIRDNIKIVEMHKVREIAQQNTLSLQHQSEDDENK